MALMPPSAKCRLLSMACSRVLMWNSVEFPWKYELHQFDRPVRLRESAASLKTARRSPDRLRSSPSAVIRGSTGRSASAAAARAKTRGDGAGQQSRDEATAHMCPIPPGWLRLAHRPERIALAKSLIPIAIIIIGDARLPVALGRDLISVLCWSRWLCFNSLLNWK